MTTAYCDLSKTFALLDALPPGTDTPHEAACYDAPEIVALGRLLSRLLYAPSPLLRKLQESGVTLTRSDFYSEIPTVSDVEQSFAKPSRLSLDHLFSNGADLLAHLESLVPYAADFDPPHVRARDDEFSWEGGGFSYSDAMTYYAMIRKYRPRRIIEVGCGSSTLVAKLARDRNGVGEITAVNPFPEPYLAALDGVELVRSRVQDLDASFFSERLRDGDFLFIDSTHTVKHDSDCLHLYLRVLPAIRASIFVHVHDVYLPGPMPLHMMRQHQVFWTEQYLLAAYMTSNPFTRTLYGSAYHHRTNRDCLRRLMHGRFADGGASFWFTQTPTPAVAASAMAPTRSIVQLTPEQSGFATGLVTDGIYSDVDAVVKASLTHLQILRRASVFSPADEVPGIYPTLEDGEQEMREMLAAYHRAEAARIGS